MHPAHLGHHDRGYLPHRDFPGHGYAITYRLADALPAAAMRRIDGVPTDIERRQLIERRLDAGYGSCLLARPQVASLVIASWRQFADLRYRLLAWVVMPNHVHVAIVLAAGHLLDRVVSTWKSYTAKAINRAGGSAGRVWQPDYWDRYLRDEAHALNAVRYIRENPVKAGLVAKAEEWRWGSAWNGTRDR